jgi:(1->4)-alpha-D-glucan 1-alpha-D-glucosylmutase
MAKAFEDTFLYVYNPLVSLNEVGGDPRPSVASRSDFYQFVKDRSKHWPHSMNATTTHDTKRSEDVRARISVLSEIPERWEKCVDRWAKWNAPFGTGVSGHPVPDRNEEIFLYQTLLGMWPQEEAGKAAIVERLQQYAIKATREAMVHTRWTKPNAPHEEALQKFIAGMLRAGSKNAFLRNFSDFESRVAYYGMLNGLSQTLLKIIAPGFPDFYQGSELWDLRLVDPDNRQQVDFERRKQLLAAIKVGAKNPSTNFLADLTTNWKDARIKLYLIAKSLNFRREHFELFLDADFTPLPATGRRKTNVVAFARRKGRQWAIAIVPRWLARAGYQPQSTTSARFWDRTEIRLPSRIPGQWLNILTGEDVTFAGASKRSFDLAPVLRHFPIALLSNAGAAKPRKPKHDREK